MKRVRIVVSGFVQGVMFRAYARDTARGLGVKGFVRNLASGDVEIVAEGEAGALERLTAWARRGPPAARVDRVTVEESEPTGEFSDFEIRR